MKCPKCDKSIKDNLDICPFCSTRVKSLDVSSDDALKDNIELIEKMEEQLSKTIELKPTKKKIRDDSEVSLEETIAIGVEHNNSLLDEINRQIDMLNEDAEKRPIYKEDKDEYDDFDDEKLESLASFKRRRKVLVFTAFASIILISVMIVLLVVTNNLSNKSKINNDFDSRLSSSITTYYETSELDNLIYLMEDVKSDSEKIVNIQSEVKTACTSWVLRYIDEDVNSKEEFENITYKYRDLIDGLYRYALVKNDDQYIRALTESDYDEIIGQFDQVYTDSLVFYEAIDLYNAKDYNRSYYMFGKIEKDNHYYDKSISYVDKIYENIIELLKKDITKLEKGIDEFTDKDKLDRYIIIEETILEYNNVYTVELSDNEEYQKLLSSYTSKVSEYTELVYNK